MGVVGGGSLGGGSAGAAAASGSRGTFILTNYRLAYLDYRFNQTSTATVLGSASSSSSADRADALYIPEHHRHSSGLSTTLRKSCVALYQCHVTIASLAYQFICLTADASCEVPFFSINRIERTADDYLSIKTKDFRHYMFAFDDKPAWLEGVITLIQKCVDCN
jgi:hypothetical protein